jgi:hypothetical protein
MAETTGQAARAASAAATASRPSARTSFQPFGGKEAGLVSKNSAASPARSRPSRAPSSACRLLSDSQAQTTATAGSEASGSPGRITSSPRKRRRLAPARRVCTRDPARIHSSTLVMDLTNR